KVDYWPVCSPDQKWVYYDDPMSPHIYRVPLDGSGKTEAIIDMPQDYWAGPLGISPDGKSLAAVATKAAGATALKIGVFELGSSSPPRMLDASHYSRSALLSTLQFSSDGKWLDYAIREDGVDNLWVQPLDGSAGHPITNFKSEQIWSFSLSPDGKSLA